MTFLSEMKNHKVRCLKTMILYTVFITYGLISGIVGPALMDLQIQVQTSISNVSYALPARALGSIIGTSVMGYIYSKVNYQLMVSISMFIMAGFIVILPFTVTFEELIATFCAIGFMQGLIFGGTNVYLIDLWGKENPPFLQALHFVFGVGALLAPLLAKPFLVECMSIDDFDNVTIIEQMTSNGTIWCSDILPEDTQLIYPFVVTAATAVISGGLLLSLWKFHPKSNTHPSRMLQSVIAVSATQPDQKEGIEGQPQATVTFANIETESQVRWKWTVIFVGCLFFPLYFGLELTYGAYLTVFAFKSPIHMAKEDGANITSVYWTTFTCFRLISVFLVEILGTRLTIIMNLALIGVANVVLIPWGATSSLCLWIGSCLMGIGCSSIWGCFFGFMEQHFVVTSQIASILIVCNMSGELIFPMIIGAIIEYDPNIFLYSSAFCGFGMMFFFAIICLICTFKLKPKY